MPIGKDALLPLSELPVFADLVRAPPRPAAQPTPPR
jgi:hypothetical protein